MAELSTQTAHHRAHALNLAPCAQTVNPCKPVLITQGMYPREVRRTWRGRATYYTYGCAGGGLVSRRHLRRACVALLGIEFVVWGRRFHDKGQCGGGDDGDGQVFLRQLGCRSTPFGLEPHAYMASASVLYMRGACGVRAGAPLRRPPPRQRRPTAQAHILGGWGCRPTAQAHPTGSAGRRLRHASWVLHSGSVARARMHGHFLTPCPTRVVLYTLPLVRRFHRRIINTTGGRAGFSVVYLPVVSSSSPAAQSPRSARPRLSLTARDCGHQGSMKLSITSLISCCCFCCCCCCC